MNEPFLEGYTVYLRVPAAEDVSAGSWHTWYNDYKNTIFNSHGVFPITREQELEYLKNAQNSPSTLILAVVSKKEDALIGNISLQNIDLLNRKADISLTIGEPKYRTRTTGLEAMALMTTHAFSRLNLNRIQAQAHEGLARWVNMLKILGYQLEGTLRQDFLRDGKYANSLLFAVLADDYMALKKARNGNILFDDLHQLLQEVVKVAK